MNRLYSKRFLVFWAEVDCQLASLGATDAWSNEVRPRFDDGMSVNEAVEAIIAGREGDHALSPWLRACREHALTGRELGVAG